MGAAAKQQTAPLHGVVVISPGELTDIVERAVRSALEMAPATSASEYMTLDQCAELLHSNPRTVQRWVAKDGLPAMRVGPEYRFRRDQVREWMAQHQIKTE